MNDEVIGGKWQVSEVGMKVYLLKPLLANPGGGSRVSVIIPAGTHGVIDEIVNPRTGIVMIILQFAGHTFSPVEVSGGNYSLVTEE